MKIYTKTGDKGSTSLLGGCRVLKNHLKIESYGTVDELNSYIGLLKDQLTDNSLKQTLIHIQNNLFTVGAMLAAPPKNDLLKKGRQEFKILKISNESVLFLEENIDQINENLPAITQFILPGGHQTVSICHIARCVCRRAERLTVALSGQEDVCAIVLMYLNRLSDYLFVLARKLTQELNAEEIKWTPKKP
ncbi:MAG: cob(I)yrinic acid a,c-diamide adenosyltransferase [Tenacibaculum sp.]